MNQYIRILLEITIIGLMVGLFVGAFLYLAVNSPNVSKGIVDSLLYGRISL